MCEALNNPYTYVLICAASAAAVGALYVAYALWR